MYIVRANVLTEIDGAIGLLNLESCAKPMDIGTFGPLLMLSFTYHLQTADPLTLFFAALSF